MEINRTEINHVGFPIIPIRRQPNGKTGVVCNWASLRKSIVIENSRPTETLFPPNAISAYATYRPYGQCACVTRPPGSSLGRCLRGRPRITTRNASHGTPRHFRARENSRRASAAQTADTVSVARSSRTGAHVRRAIITPQ